MLFLWVNSVAVTKRSFSLIQVILLKVYVSYIPELYFLLEFWPSLAYSKQHICMHNLYAYSAYYIQFSNIAYFQMNIICTYISYASAYVHIIFICVYHACMILIPGIFHAINSSSSIHFFGFLQKLYFSFGYYGCVFWSSVYEPQCRQKKVFAIYSRIPAVKYFQISIKID